MRLAAQAHAQRAVVTGGQAAGTPDEGTEQVGDGRGAEASQPPGPVPQHGERDQVEREVGLGLIVVDVRHSGQVGEQDGAARIIRVAGRMFHTESGFVRHLPPSLNESVGRLGGILQLAAEPHQILGIAEDRGHGGATERHDAQPYDLVCPALLCDRKTRHLGLEQL